MATQVMNLHKVMYHAINLISVVGHQRVPFVRDVERLIELRVGRALILDGWENTAVGRRRLRGELNQLMTAVGQDCVTSYVTVCDETNNINGRPIRLKIALQLLNGIQMKMNCEAFASEREWQAAWAHWTSGKKADDSGVVQKAPKAPVDVMEITRIFIEGSRS